jgi:hypothetical protein
MIKVVGAELWRGGEKIGWVEGQHIRAHDGKKLGYFEGNLIYGEDGRKLAYVEGDHLISYGSNSKISLEQVSEGIEGGVLSEGAKCAVYVLLGD